MVKYLTISNATLATVIADLETRQIGAANVVQILHDGSLYIAIVKA